LAGRAAPNEQRLLDVASCWSGVSVPPYSQRACQALTIWQTPVATSWDAPRMTSLVDRLLPDELWQRIQQRISVDSFSLRAVKGGT
jgi:hypothetical protein